MPFRFDETDASQRNGITASASIPRRWKRPQASGEESQPVAHRAELGGLHGRTERHLSRFNPTIKKHILQFKWIELNRKVVDGALTRVT